MFEHRYPGTDLHEIDLAYILGEIQALKYKLDNFVKENTFHLADPLDWNITSQYSACTIVRYHDDRLYLSAKPVPAGIQITNTEYWLNLIDCSGGGGGDYQEREVSFIPTETQQMLDVYPEAGYDALSKVRVIVQAISNLFVGSGIPRRSSSDLTASGSQVSAPSGYYANAAAKSVQAGTEGTPTVTKGPVSNHAIAVTPAVTNTEGYIAGGTKTGSAVSVTAAELDSGTKSIVANGTGIDVVGYAAVDVAVPGQSPTLQTKSVSYTPTESQQTAAVTPDTGYDGLAEVDITVNAVPNTYVGSQVPRQAATVITPTTSSQTAVAAGKYTEGAVTVEAVVCENLTAANIVSGVTVKVGTATDDDSVASVTGTASGGGYSIDDICEHNYSGVVNYTGTSLQGGTFRNSSITEFHAPNQTTLISARYSNIFTDCTSLTTIDFPKLTAWNNANEIWAGCSALTSVILPVAHTFGNNSFSRCYSLQYAVFPMIKNTGWNTLSDCRNLIAVDIGDPARTGADNVVLSANWLNGAVFCPTFIIRQTMLASMSNINGLGTRFVSGGAGGTIYIPESLYDHLGDGTALDYKAATNWSTIEGYGTITWAKIEGSQYENYYADGTPIT